MALNRGLMLSHHSQKVLSGRLGWVHVMAGLFCQARESNPGLRCRSVMFYHCSTERCWTQMRGTTKVTKIVLYFQEQQQKSLAYRSQQKGSWKEKQFQKIKYLEEQKILSVGDRCYLQSMAKITTERRETKYSKTYRGARGTSIVQ